MTYDAIPAPLLPQTTLSLFHLRGTYAFNIYPLVVADDEALAGQLGAEALAALASHTGSFESCRPRAVCDEFGDRIAIFELPANAVDALREPNMSAEAFLAGVGALVVDLVGSSFATAHAVMEHQFQQPLSETRAQLRSGDVACRRRQRQQIISAPPIVRSPCATLVLRTSASESHVAQSLGPLSLARALNPPDMGNSPDRDPTPFTHDAGGDPTAAALRWAMLGDISAGRATPWAAACMDPEARVRRLILCATPREWCGVATCALGLARTVEQIEAVVLIVSNPNMRTSFKMAEAVASHAYTASLASVRASLRSTQLPPPVTTQAVTHFPCTRSAWTALFPRPGHPWTRWSSLIRCPGDSRFWFRKGLVRSRVASRSPFSLARLLHAMPTHLVPEANALHARLLSDWRRNGTGARMIATANDSRLVVCTMRAAYTGSEDPDATLADVAAHLQTVVLDVDHNLRTSFRTAEAVEAHARLGSLSLTRTHLRPCTTRISAATLCLNELPASAPTNAFSGSAEQIRAVPDLSVLFPSCDGDMQEETLGALALDLPTIYHPPTPSLTSNAHTFSTPPSCPDGIPLPELPEHAGLCSSPTPAIVMQVDGGAPTCAAEPMSASMFGTLRSAISFFSRTMEQRASVLLGDSEELVSAPRSYTPSAASTHALTLARERAPPPIITRAPPPVVALRQPLSAIFSATSGFDVRSRTAGEGKKNRHRPLILLTPDLLHASKAVLQGQRASAPYVGVRAGGSSHVSLRILAIPEKDSTGSSSQQPSTSRSVSAGPFAPRASHPLSVTSAGKAGSVPLRPFVLPSNSIRVLKRPDANLENLTPRLTSTQFTPRRHRRDDVAGLSQETGMPGARRV